MNFLKRQLTFSQFSELKKCLVWRSRLRAVDSLSIPFRAHLHSGPSFKDFLTTPVSMTKNLNIEAENNPYIDFNKSCGENQKVFIEVYGCQMNVNDAEIVLSVLQSNGYLKTNEATEADIILILTCAIREGAEEKIWERLRNLRGLKKKRKLKENLKVGLLGCMAERLKQKVVEIDKTVDIVAGPDSYKDLPRLLGLAKDNQTAINVQLSVDETYADIMPVRISPDSVLAYVSIMRGCDNMCTYCIVPFTRGRERSRPIASIVEEVRQLSQQGVKEITLLGMILSLRGSSMISEVLEFVSGQLVLKPDFSASVAGAIMNGQNVNSYRDLSNDLCKDTSTHLVPGFKTVYKTKLGGLRFDKLLSSVAEVDRNMRIRFTSPHPKDFPDEVLDVIAKYPNVCCNLHLPAQSGNNRVLEQMRRGYTREAYLELVHHVKKVLPSVTLSSDFIAGFCGETEEEFRDTLTLISEVGYSTAFLFAYSMREKTTAHRRYVDDIPLHVKNRRVAEMVATFRESARRINEAQIGQTQLVLVEGTSRRSDEYLAGRNDGNVKVILPRGTINSSREHSDLLPLKPGDFVAVLINAANSQVLKGIPLYHSSITDYYENIRRREIVQM